jgi:hypothetical protein
VTVWINTNERQEIYREGVACSCENAAINEEREGRQKQKKIIELIQDQSVSFATVAS